MKNTLIIATIALTALSFGKVYAGAPQDAVLNGDFSANGADFDNPTAPGMNGNGQIGAGGDPSSITDFDATVGGGGSIGIEFPGDNPPYGPNLPPAGFHAAGDPTYFAYLQGAGSELTQTIDLTAGELYTLSFLSAPRGNNNNGLTTSGDMGQVEILNSLGAVNVVTAANTAVGTDLTNTTVKFVATGGSETLVLKNTSLGGDNTVDFSDIAVLTPEPSTYALMFAGLGVLLLAARSRRSTRA